METRRPPLRAWLAIGGAGLIVALGAGAWLVQRDADGPLAPPDAPWPATGRIVVYLCGKAGTEASCENQPVTPRQMQEIQRRLGTSPGLKVVRFESRQQAYVAYKAAFADDRRMLDGVTAASMPESFKGELTDSSRLDAKGIQALPGVAKVQVSATDFWKGRADLGIRLCAEKSFEGQSRCQGRGKATDQEKDAIYQALRGVQGVTAVYLEGHEHSWENVRRVSGMDVSGGEPYTPEFFHLKIGSPEVQEQVKRVVGQLPGVDYVIDHNKV